VHLTGKVALVTGAGSGIGRATALLLAAHGAKVVVADLDEGAAAATARQIGGDGTAVRADVTRQQDVDDLLAETIATYGRLDIAVNNAGVSGNFARIADITAEAWERTIDVNLTGVFRCLQAEIPHLLASGGGAIVNVSSAAGQMGVPGLAAYSASKHAVIGLTKSAALEYAREGIRINAVLPGTVHTPMLEAFAGGPDVVEKMGRGTPIGRLAQPEEVAQTIAWLVSDASSYVTGHALAVDGGALAT
jgi:NAD(P)-dependent dehydrogenase (short-subunit alcohol dehydrogenase family)